MSNPYLDRPDHCFWRREIADVKPSKILPYLNPAFEVTKTTKVGTAGSCFAQNISRYLAKSGYDYFVVEKAPTGFEPNLSRALNYGVYSARYGNIYTARQLKQLLQECFEGRVPQEPIWKRGDRFVDPLRPTITATGHLRENDIVEDRAAHIAAVKHLFETLDVFVFTLGLTEGWQSNIDGTALPVVPGTRAGGEYNDKDYAFFNQSYPDVLADMTVAREIIKRVNPNAKIVLTVSPVPLVATMEDQSVLSATGYSKATLRAVAGDMEKQFDDICYFPSYEIITGGFNRGAYFETDLRSAREEGVRHAMRLFFSAFTKDGAPNLHPQKGELLRTLPKGKITIGDVEITDDVPSAQSGETDDDATDGFVDLVCDELLNDAQD